MSKELRGRSQTQISNNDRTDRPRHLKGIWADLEIIYDLSSLQKGWMVDLEVGLESAKRTESDTDIK